jgi:hypothetical protein
MLVFVSVNLLIFDILCFYPKINLKNVTFNNVTKLVEVIVPLVNFIWVFFLYVNSLKDKEKAERIEIEKYWYHDFILKNILMDLSNFFKLCIVQADDAIKTEDMNALKPLLRDMKDELKCVTNSFDILLHTVDNKFGDEFTDSLKKTGEEITTSLLSLYSKDITSKDHLIALKEAEYNLIDKLYKFDKKIYA